MINKFLPLILCIISMYSGCKLFNINDGRTSERIKAEQKILCEKGVKINATLQNEYTEVESGSSVSYRYKFDYTVDGENYIGDISNKKELEIPIIEITYDPQDPNSYTTGEPCKYYAAVKDNPPLRPVWLEIVGAGFVLLGLGYIRSSILRIFSRGNQPIT